MACMLCGRLDGEQYRLGLAGGFDHAKNGNPVRSTDRFASTMQMKIASKR